VLLFLGSFFEDLLHAPVRDDAKLDAVLSENSIRLGIRVARQNHRMIGADACCPALTRNVHR
jgi:hypothetical protein